MSTICIIAEKPSVARELAGIVGANKKGNGYMEGNGYLVTWAIGHLITLAMPGDYGFEKFDAQDLPLVPSPFRLVVRQIRNGRDYVNDPAAERQLAVIGNCFRRSDSIIVATDAGREGELIFRYIYSYLNSDKPFRRLWISSLTDKAIREGLSSLHHGSDFDNLYRAGKARSEADWLVGINASRALVISAGKKGYSLGRVQTPTLSIICRRYLENKNFKSVPYWKLVAVIDKDGHQWKATSENDYRLREEAVAAMQSPHAAILSVVGVEKKVVRNEPPLLYDLTALQKEANLKYGFTADITLSIAQSLYEKKLTTYPRTGSRYIGEDIFEEIPELVSCIGRQSDYKETAAVLLSGKLNRHSVDASKVTDHHALLVTGNTPAHLNADETRIYTMILSRMLEAFLAASEKEILTVVLESGGIRFALKAQTVTFKGWRSVRDEKADDEVQTVARLPNFVKGEEVKASSLHDTEHKTKPKPLFTEASLLAAMENAGREVEDDKARKAMSECGIGTPATRASIIETLVIREYIRRDRKTLVPTDKGLSVYDIVRDKHIANAEMTGQWELALARIENGEQDAGTFARGIRDYTQEICRELLQSPIDTKADCNLYTCPLCRKNAVRIYPKIAKCTAGDCTFKIFREVCHKTLSEKEITSLLDNGRTPVLKGLTGKAGRKFNAALVLHDDGSTSFEFNNKTGKH